VAPPDEWGPTGHYTEVWDTLEEPYEDEEGHVLPKGELVETKQAKNVRFVRELMFDVWRDKQITSAGSWRNRGMM